MERINGLRQRLNLRDRLNASQRIRNGADRSEERQRYVSSISTRNSRYNNALKAYRRYDANMQRNSLRTRGLYLKHQQHPQSVYMANGNG